MNVIGVFNVLAQHTSLSPAEWEKELDRHDLKVDGDGLIIRQDADWDEQVYMQDAIQANKAKHSAKHFATEVTPEKALEIFAQLEAMQSLDFNNDACFARAHFMVEKIMDMQVIAKKAWARGIHESIHDDAPPLKVTFPDGQVVPWVRHVAPVLKVIGIDEPMVFDPCLAKGPVTLSDWTGMIGALPENVAVAEFGCEPWKGYGDYNRYQATTHATDTEARKDIAESTKKGSKPRQRFESGFFAKV